MRVNVYVTYAFLWSRSRRWQMIEDGSLWCNQTRNKSWRLSIIALFSVNQNHSKFVESARISSIGKKTTARQSTQLFLFIGAWGSRKSAPSFQSLHLNRKHSALTCKLFVFDICANRSHNFLHFLSPSVSIEQTRIHQESEAKCLLARAKRPKMTAF